MITRRLPRSSIYRKSKEKYSDVTLVLPPHRSTRPCVGCGEDSIYCTHQRKSGQYLCENCFRKAFAWKYQNSGRKKNLWDIKEQAGCVICEESDPACLDFHHLHPKKKKFSIGSLPPSVPQRMIDIERRKCVVICANCHQKVEVAIKKNI